MCDYPERLEAMKLAIEFSVGRPMTAEKLIFASTVIQNYLSKGSKRSDGSTLRVVFGAPDGGTGYSSQDRAAINDFDSLSDDASDVSPLGVYTGSSAPINRYSVAGRESSGDIPNQSLSGQVSIHSSSSSVLADGDSGDSVVAAPRNNGTPDTSEKGVNGDA